MAPAVFYRVEHPKDGNGLFNSEYRKHTMWRLDSRRMPTWTEETEGTYPIEGRHFAFTPQGMRWLSHNDVNKAAKDGFVGRTYLCEPGTFLIAGDQAQFDKEAATVIDTYNWHWVVIRTYRVTA